MFRKIKKWNELQYTHGFIRGAVDAYILKGGFVRHLYPERTEDWIREGKASTRPDWGILRPEKRPGPKPFPRLVLQCAACKRSLVFKGKTHEHAVENAWRGGWQYSKEGTGEEDVCLCPKCKPGKANGVYKTGSKVHNRADGGIYKIDSYKPKGGHTINFGKWPELWCTDNRGATKVFIFWNGKPPEGLVKIGGPE